MKEVYCTNCGGYGEEITCDKCGHCGCNRCVNEVKTIKECSCAKLMTDEEWARISAESRYAINLYVEKHKDTEELVRVLRKAALEWVTKCNRLEEELERLRAERKT